MRQLGAILLFITVSTPVYSTVNVTVFAVLDQAIVFST